MNKDTLFQKAITIAAEAHKDQVDKYGAPYLGHVTRVMNAGNSTDEQIVGAPHDLVEDTSWIFEDLEKQGFPDHIVEALRCVTRTIENENYDVFIKRTKSKPLAVKVKVNDLVDNLDIRRMDDLIEKRFAKDQQILKSIQITAG
jgi:(p)ppGpp synthase/HD superfamily hydrolase